MKRYYLSIVMIILIVAVILFSACNNKSEDQQDQSMENSNINLVPTTKQEMESDNGIMPLNAKASAYWAPLEGGDSEESIIRNSVLIVKGTPLTSDIEILGGKLDAGGFPFSVFTFKITDIFAEKIGYNSVVSKSLLNKSNTIFVRMNGAVIDGNDYTYILEDAPLMEFDKEYILFLRYDKDIEMYWPVGDRFGVAEIDKNGALHFTNELAARLATTFEGARTKSFITELMAYPNINKYMVINEDNSSLNDFIH